MQVGLNLFSIKNLLTTEEEFFNTTKALKEMGYAYMQFSGAEFVPERIKRVSESLSMPVCLTHVPMDRILGDTDALMADHEKFGCRNIGLGMMPLDVLLSEERFLKTVEELNAAAERIEARGFSFFYHHHHFEFLKHDGETVFDYMIRNAPHINFTLDTYWLQYGGVDVCKTIERLRGRIRCVHLKDYRIEAKWDEKGNVKMDPVFAPIGDGTLDFAAILPKAHEAGAAHFLVEQDNASDMEDPLAQVERSIRYLNTHF